MTEDQDNAGEVVADAVRVALTAAGQLAEQAARRREADLREAERESAARVATVQSQLSAERELALRSVRDILRRGDAATVEEVVRAWEQARSWNDPTMDSERAQLEGHVRERFGVEAPALAAGPATDEQLVATSLTTRDIEAQAHDGRERSEARIQVVALQEAIAGAGVDHEAAVAQALASQSHPKPARQAARKPQAKPVGRPQGKRRGSIVEVQSPDR